MGSAVPATADSLEIHARSGERQKMLPILTVPIYRRRAIPCESIRFSLARMYYIRRLCSFCDPGEHICSLDVLDVLGV